MGNNQCQVTPTSGGGTVRPISLYQKQSSETAELGLEIMLPKRNSSHTKLDWERWQGQQFHHKPRIRRTSSQCGYRPRSASLRRLRSVHKRRFWKSPTSVKSAKIEADKHKLQEEIALLAACARGDLNEVEKLVDSGVDVNSSDQNRMTALHYAAMHTRDDVIKSLISRGAEVDTADLMEGFSAIHCVVINASQKSSLVNHLESSLTALTKAGCSVNATNFNYATPLHIAAQKGNRDAVQVLLRLGADPNKVDNTGRDCFEVAKNELVKDYMKILFEMPSKKEHQLESRLIYHILHPPLPSVPAPLPSVNPPKLLCSRGSSYEEALYHTLEFRSPPSCPYETPLPLTRHGQFPQYTSESHLYHMLESTPTIIPRIPTVPSSPRKRKARKY